MGRPLNKKFFGDGSGKFSCTAYLPGAAAAQTCYIVRQRSNRKYEVADEATVASTALVVGAKYIIVTVGGADYTTVGAADNNVGTKFTATGTSAGGAGTAREYAVCATQAAAPAANFEMRISVQGENAQVPTTANIAFTSAGGTGALLTVDVDNVAAHYGYWADGTNVALGGTTDGTVDYTVDGSGKIATVTINTAGSANTQAGSPVALADTAAANPPLQYARIINAHSVKTYEGSTFAHPAAGGDASGGRGWRPWTEGDIETQA